MVVPVIRWGWSHPQKVLFHIKGKVKRKLHIYQVIYIQTLCLKCVFFSLIFKTSLWSRHFHFHFSNVETKFPQVSYLHKVTWQVRDRARIQTLKALLFPFNYTLSQGKSVSSERWINLPRITQLGNDRIRVWSKFWPLSPLSHTGGDWR